MTALPEGYQVKARDHDGKVHDERWTTSPQTARSVLDALGSDPLVAEAWTEPALPAEHERTVLVGDTYVTPDEAAQYEADEAEALRVLGADDEAEIREVERQHEVETEDRSEEAGQ